MKFLILITSIVFSGALASANCSDQICNVRLGKKTVALDVSWCALGTQPALSYTDGSGGSHALPSQEEPISIVGGFWNDTRGFKLRFVDGGGGEIFNLQVTKAFGRHLGRVTADLPGLKVKNAPVICPAP